MYSLVLMMAATSSPEMQNFGFSSGWCASCNTEYAGAGHGVQAQALYPINYTYACSGCAGNVTSYRSCLGYTPNYWMPFSCFGYGIYGGTTYYFPYPYPAGPPITTYGFGFPRLIESTMPRIEKGFPKKKAEEIKPLPEPRLPEPKKITNRPLAPNRGEVVIRLPADAKLYANGKETDLNSSERTFSTPALEEGQDYQYLMRIEYQRDGRTVTDSRVVNVRAGRSTLVDFAEQASAGIAVTAARFGSP